MSAAHTPGPWTVKQYRYSRAREYMLDAGGVHLADIYGEANAALIAKAPIAPRLAEALACISLAERDTTSSDNAKVRDMARIARAALAEWDGKTVEAEQAELRG